MGSASCEGALHEEAALADELAGPAAGSCRRRPGRRRRRRPRRPPPRPRRQPPRCGPSGSCRGRPRRRRGLVLLLVLLLVAPPPSSLGPGRRPPPPRPPPRRRPRRRLGSIIRSRSASSSISSMSSSSSISSWSRSFLLLLLELVVGEIDVVVGHVCAPGGSAYGRRDDRGSIPGTPPPCRGDPPSNDGVASRPQVLAPRLVARRWVRWLRQPSTTERSEPAKPARRGAFARAGRTGRDVPRSRPVRPPVAAPSPPARSGGGGRRPQHAGPHEGVGVHRRPAVGVHLEVEVGPTAGGVAGVAHVADDGAGGCPSWCRSPPCGCRGTASRRRRRGGTGGRRWPRWRRRRCRRPAPAPGCRGGEEVGALVGPAARAGKPQSFT